MEPSAQAIVFLDLDGTLSLHHQAPSLRVAQSIQTLRKNGHLAFISTGRSRSNISENISSIGFDGVISLAGAHVMIGKEVLTDEAMPPDLLDQLLALFQETGANGMLEGPEGCIILSPRGKPHTLLHPYFRTQAEIYATHPGLRVSKFVVPVEDAPLLAPFRERFSDVLTFENTNMGYEELTLRNFNKGTAIRQVLDYLGRDRRNSYAIGDSENDVVMFQAVETPIAMGNAQEHVKLRASYVTSSIQEDGVCAALEHFGLI